MTAAKLPSLQAPEMESVFALHLLCEAWLLSRKWPDELSDAQSAELKAALQIKGEGLQLPTGIDLSAPSEWQEWLKPFKIKPGDSLDPLLDEMTTAELRTSVEKFFNPKNTSQPEFGDVKELFIAIKKSVESNS